MVLKFNILISLLVLSCASITSLKAQTPNQADSSTIKKINVFIDCEFCDNNYIKQEINYVNYVRDQNEANVHILITRQNTGSGGLEYSLFMVGLKNFEFMNDILTYNEKPDNTEDETRKGITAVIRAGLMRYIAKTDMVSMLKVTLDIPEKTKEETIIDPWKNWVFNSNLSGSFSGEELTKSNSYYLDLSASKVTEKQKILFSYYFNYRDNKFVMPDTTIKGYNYSQNFNFIWVKSINQHWSAGVVTDDNSSSYRNIKLRSNIFPAVEYNLFPYSESNSRQLRFMYSAGYSHIFYNDTTIFNKINEGLFGQSLDVTLIVKKTWGSVTMAVNGFNYFHDFSKNQLNLWGNMSVRLFKGFSVNFSGQISSIHDQIYLPKAGASAEEILLQQRQMSTSYSYYGSIGISYTFGSIYNNVVNPRFGF
jgi:hypothetical protein